MYYRRISQEVKKIWLSQVEKWELKGFDLVHLNNIKDNFDEMGDDGFMDEFGESLANLRKIPKEFN